MNKKRNQASKRNFKFIDNGTINWNMPADYNIAFGGINYDRRDKRVYETTISIAK